MDIKKIIPYLFGLIGIMYIVSIVIGSEISIFEIIIFLLLVFLYFKFYKMEKSNEIN